MAFHPPLRLEGRWVALVPLELAHADGLAAAATAPEIWRYFRGGDLRAPGRMAEFIAELLRRQESGSDLCFCVLERASGRPVGMTRYLNIQRVDGVVEVGGSWLERTLWRTPFNTESKYLLLRHAFEEEGCQRVEIRTDLRNERSQRAIERLGAVREGVLREHTLLSDGFRRSSVIYGLLASEWPAVRSRLERYLARHWPAPTPDARSGPGDPAE